MASDALSTYIQSSPSALPWGSLVFSRIASNLKSRALLEKGQNGVVYKTFLDILSYGSSKEKTASLNLMLEHIKKPLPLKPQILLEKTKEPQQSNVIISKSYKS